MLKFNLKKLVLTGILSALALALVMTINFPILPWASFLRYEPADAVIIIGAMIMGPVAGLAILFISALIQAFTINAQDGLLGFFMHFLASGTFLLTSVFIYRKFRNNWGLIGGLAAGVIAMTVVMIPANLILDPILYRMPLDAVKAMIFPIFVPFNLIKAGINSVITFAVFGLAGKQLTKIYKK